MSTALAMQERQSPSRPTRLGTRRRKPMGASRSAERRAPSLDTGKQLATSDANRTVREWRLQQETEADQYRAQRKLQRRLCDTLHILWQDAAAAGDERAALAWEKQWFQVNQCQAQWVGYRADCCLSQTRPVAVPIGCNHRLCPLCAWHRSAKARAKVRTLFDRLEHPALITLTVPNTTTIRKHDLTLFRQRVRKFLAIYKRDILGGIYALETTYNRVHKTWHVHCHILADLSDQLPTKDQRVELAGQKVYAFTALKLRMEFEWLRLWGGAWGRAPRRNANYEARQGQQWTFERWVQIGRQMALKEWRDGAMREIPLSPGERASRTQWNAENRRVVDIRPVRDREGAAREVLKYITKVADFVDVPEAVEQFVPAVRSARLVQTFGTWFGVKLDTPADSDNPRDWEHLTCECGMNHWLRMGVFYAGAVEMRADGRWILKREFDHNSRGNVPRPTIRALDERERGSRE